MKVVLFSGGCDSTLVLYEAAMEHMKFKNYDNEIIALTICNGQLPNDTKQKEAVEKIKAEFIKRELQVQFNTVTIENPGIGITTGGDLYNPKGLTHPAIWIAHAPLYCRSTDVILTGYHNGDDYWQVRNHAETVLAGINGIMEKQISIKYPLQNITKRNIITRLKARGLYDLCWYCESNNAEPCGKCDPCKLHRTALWQIENFEDEICDNEYSKIEDECTVEKEPTIAVDAPVCISGS